MTESYLRAFPAVDAGGGVTRRVLSERPEIMVVEFAFQDGGTGAAHSHPHVQSTYVQSGRFDFTIDGETFTVSAGDSFVVPSGATHSCVAREAGVLIDTFAPRRDDFL
jgi:quercetin dioxygenase-like cupin family protein